VNPHLAKGASRVRRSARPVRFQQ